MSKRFPDYVVGLRHFPRITPRQANRIINSYGMRMTLRNRTPIMDNPEVCPCVANDDIFHQINPSCPVCGGTGIIDGEQYRDSSVKVLLFPAAEFGFTGSSTLYTIPGRMERVWHEGYMKGNVPVDIGDFLIESYVKPETSETITMEYEVYDKQLWRIGQGFNRANKTVYCKVLTRKTEYAKTIDTVSNY